ncbi:MAG: hypothetical protein ABWY56_01095 [Propionibacteriaceae bacterium]
MIPGSVVAVYGLKPGRTRPAKLGTGSLVHPRLVIVADALESQLAGQDPPSVLRVGIGYVSHGQQVEVIEVSQTLRSIATDTGRLWGLELVADSAAPLARFNTSKLFASGGGPAAAEQGALPSESGDNDGAAHLTLTAPAVAAGKAKRVWCFLFPNASFCH